MKVWGIPNCDTMKKAMNWLDKNGHPYEFCNYREGNLTATRIRSWLKTITLEQLVNKKSTSYRALSAAGQEALGTAKTAIPLILQYPALIKRPLLEFEETVVTGFNDEVWAGILGKPKKRASRLL
jgi:arsenate reductase